MPHHASGCHNISHHFRWAFLPQICKTNGQLYLAFITMFDFMFILSDLIWQIIRCKCFKFLLSRDLWTRLSDADGSNDRYVFNVDEGARPLEEVRPITEDAAPMAVSTDPDVTTERALCDISSDLKYLIEILKRRRQVQRSQWYYLALAVNKMACFIYIIGTILITVIILSPWKYCVEFV